MWVIGAAACLMLCTHCFPCSPLRDCSIRCNDHGARNRTAHALNRSIIRSMQNTDPAVRASRSINSYSVFQLVLLVSFFYSIEYTIYLISATSVSALPATHCNSELCLLRYCLSVQSVMRVLLVPPHRIIHTSAAVTIGARACWYWHRRGGCGGRVGLVTIHGRVRVCDENLRTEMRCRACGGVGVRECG
jgi:hypothetical protein